MRLDSDSLAKDILAGNRRALAKALSLAEEGGIEGNTLMKNLISYTGKAHLIGVTGAPGVGKSTLIDVLIGQIRNDNLKVAVLAIDPSSPFSGGAILGDRIRMQKHTLDPGVFIRSMANRGHAGGITIATYDAVRILETAGYEIIIIETVGVGQSELAIASTADTTVLILMPSSGDDVQALKSGILEVADIFVVNKADLPGADQTQADILASLKLRDYNSAWRPPVVLTSAASETGLKELWLTLKQHHEFLSHSELLNKRRHLKIRAELAEILAAQTKERFLQLLTESSAIEELVTKILEGKQDTHSAAAQILANLLGASPDIS